MSRTVAVIGASGFVGRTLSVRLRDQGHEVLAYGGCTTGEPADGIEWRTWDATSEPLELPPSVDAVYYLSQSPHYRDFANRANHVLGVNAVGPAVAATAAREAGANLFCFASTGSVYAPAFEPLTESHPVRRNDGYALSKLTGEEAIALVAGEMNVTSVRIFGAYGPGQEGMLVPRMREGILAGKPVMLVPGPDGELDGGFRISLTYVDDLVRGLLALGTASSDGRSLPPVLNVASPQAVDIRGIATAIGRVVGRDPVFEMADNPRPGDLVADVSKFRELSDMEFLSFDEGIARTFDDVARRSA